MRAICTPWPTIPPIIVDRKSSQSHEDQSHSLKGLSPLAWWQSLNSIAPAAPSVQRIVNTTARTKPPARCFHLLDSLIHLHILTSFLFEFFENGKKIFLCH